VHAGMDALTDCLRAGTSKRKLAFGAASCRSFVSFILTVPLLSHGDDSFHFPSPLVWELLAGFARKSHRFGRPCHGATFAASNSSVVLLHCSSSLTGRHLLCRHLPRRHLPSRHVPGKGWQMCVCVIFYSASGSGQHVVNINRSTGHRIGG